MRREEIWQLRKVAESCRYGYGCHAEVPTLHCAKRRLPYQGLGLELNGPMVLLLFCSQGLMWPWGETNQSISSPPQFTHCSEWDKFLKYYFSFFWFSFLSLYCLLFLLLFFFNPLGADNFHM